MPHPSSSQPAGQFPTPVVVDPTGADHHGQSARLRELGPVVRILLPGDVPAWVVTRHAALEQVLRSPHVTRRWRTWNAVTTGRIPDQWPLGGMFFVDNMFTADGDKHRRLRGLVAGVFTARRVQDLRPAITTIVESVLDELPGHADPGGVVDLRHHYAYPVTMRVICALLGVPQAWHDRIREQVDALFRTDLTSDQAEAIQRRRQELLADLVALRRREPAEDLTTALVHAQAAQPDVLPEPILIDTLWLLVTAGHETTLSLIVNAVRALVTHPDQKRLALTGDETTWAAVVEETLRWDGPINNLITGYTLTDLTIDGVTIPAGEALLGQFAGVGRDPDQHGPAAHLFDITRPQQRHLAFGAGAHYCLGAPLARLEASLALRALFTRYPDLALAVDPDALAPVPSLFTNSPSTLPVVLTP